MAISISYIKNGEKVFNRLTYEETSILENEVKYIPKAVKGHNQIHLDSMTKNLLKIGKEVSREDFIKGHPQAKEIFDGI